MQLSRLNSEMKQTMFYPRLKQKLTRYFIGICIETLFSIYAKCDRAICDWC